VKKIKRLDINCDLGEGLGNDKDLMPFLDTCNIACGGHAGNRDTVLSTMRLAKEQGVKIGAHPSFPDSQNFGRKEMEIEPSILKNSLIHQLDLFFEIAVKENMNVHHIKPHGALYNKAAKDENTARLILELIVEKYTGTILYCPPNSMMESLAANYAVAIHREVFADRTYQDDLSLTNRKELNALLTTPDEVISHLSLIFERKSIRSLSGKIIPIQADTVCVHGDNPAALEILKSIHFNFG
jgi:UPF0271 protein